jgi:hypothetical protein
MFFAQFTGLYRPCTASFGVGSLNNWRSDDFENEAQGLFRAILQDEKDWLCTIEFLSTDDPEARLYGADIIGYLVGYASLTNTRSLVLLADPDAGAYELLFSFSSPEEKNEFLNLVRSNEENDYIIELTPPTTEEIRNARPLATVLPQDAPHPCHADCSDPVCAYGR